MYVRKKNTDFLVLAFEGRIHNIDVVHAGQAQLQVYNEVYALHALCDAVEAEMKFMSSMMHSR